MVETLGTSQFEQSMNESRQSNSFQYQHDTQQHKEQVRQTVKITVHVRDQEFKVFCGAGNQKIRWLSDVALHRYEHFFNQDPGLAKGMRFENSTPIDMDLIICDKLKNDDHVWVILKEDLALMEAEMSKAQANM